MPLRRAVFLEPRVDIDIASVRFPLMDGDKVVWGEVSDYALRESAMRDNVPGNRTKPELFEYYRNMLEMLASELYDEGKYGPATDGSIVVRVPNGRI